MQVTWQGGGVEGLAVRAGAGGQRGLGQLLALAPLDLLWVSDGLFK